MFLNITVKKVNLIKRTNSYEFVLFQRYLTKLVYPMIFIAIRNKLDLTG